jgi:hypothetical protein
MQPSEHTPTDSCRTVAIVEKYFADDELRLFITPADDAAGQPGRMDECVVAQACTRITNCQHVEIGRTYSIAVFQDTQGLYAVKYRTPSILSPVLTQYDKNRLAAPMAQSVVTLKAITASGRKIRTQGKRSGSGGGNPRTTILNDALLRPRVA